MLKKIAVLAFVLLTTYGCSTIQSLDKESQGGAVALSFAPSETQAVMYLYRDRDSHFGLFMLDIYINEHTVTTSPRCFVRVELEPGSYFIEADHPDMLGFEDELTLTAEAGQLKFYEYKPISRFVVPGETKIIERSKEEAMANITEQNLCISPLVRLSATED